jgi:hypothetical protein
MEPTLKSSLTQTGLCSFAQKTKKRSAKHPEEHLTERCALYFLTEGNWRQASYPLPATQTRPNQNPSQSNVTQLSANSDAVRPRSRNRTSLRALSKLRPQ